MRTLGYTLSRLKPGRTETARLGSRLEDLQIEGPNPGGLKARKHVPETLPDRPALVVVLHGCTQTAAAYDEGSGWSEMADRYGFVVLFPEQQRANNPGLCFNWYSPTDIRRGEGEAASIRSAIETMILLHDLDRSRVFVTGLSAGGAMTSVMLATYPEVFAGGAVFAGLPYGCAKSVPEAFDRMRGHGPQSAAAATAAVLTASGHGGPWPSISVWHGAADHTVVPANSDALVSQWAGVHDLELSAHETSQILGHRRRVWRNAAGAPVLEEYRVAGMGHGVPIDTRDGGACGVAGPYMLESGISSTHQLVAQWKLDAGGLVGRAATQGMPADPATTGSPLQLEGLTAATAGRPPASRVQLVIEDALKRAGLMS